MSYDRLRELPKILIVDDQPTTVLVMREAVRDLGRVYFATDGTTAIELARQIVPDVVLLDIEMPGLNGYDVCEAIKSDPLLHDTDIIFVTSHDRGVHELQALSAGGIDFISKPLNVPVARARVCTHLNLRLKTKQLALAQHDLEDVVQNLPAFVAYWDTDFTNEFCNDVDGRWFGVAASRMRGMHLRDVLGLDNYRAIEKQLESMLNGENPSFDIELNRTNGERLYGQASLVRRHQVGLDVGFLMLITDVTERKLAELALYDEKERIRVTLNSIGDAVIAIDAAGHISFINPIAESMTGWSAMEAIGQPIEVVMPLQDASDGHEVINPVRLALAERRTVGMAMNCALRRRDGRPFDVEDSAAPIIDHAGKLVGAIIVFHRVPRCKRGTGDGGQDDPSGQP
jgi:PAS domain S-box-containing protein